ncbi:hypothetical protein HY484_01980 [Candidatus Woesearchaeota archaeon]|nr:hypothetical protein [Candidatus Woesearchaeota archaeon]
MNDRELKEQFDNLRKTTVSAVKNKYTLSWPGALVAVIVGTWIGSGLRCGYSPAVDIQKKTGSIESNVFEIRDDVKYLRGDINWLLKQTTPQTANVIGNAEPETFYEINGQRAYLKIDGKNVEDIVGGR